MEEDLLNISFSGPQGEKKEKEKKTYIHVGLKWYEFITEFTFGCSISQRKFSYHASSDQFNGLIPRFISIFGLQVTQGFGLYTRRTYEDDMQLFSAGLCFYLRLFWELLLYSLLYKKQQQQQHILNRPKPVVFFAFSACLYGIWEVVSWRPI